MEVGGQLHAPAALPPRKEPPIPIRQEAGWAPEAGLDAVEQRKICCSCQELNPGRPARSLVAIPTELTRLCIYMKSSLNTITMIKLRRMRGMEEMHKTFC
jgi:hypothetical protein